MEIEIDTKKNNPLLKRTEVYFTVKHANGGTPNREIIRTELADKLNSKKENVIVNILKPGFGIQETKGYAKIYSSNESLKVLERQYILKRNKIGGIKKDKKEEKSFETPTGETSTPKTSPEESQVKTKQTEEPKVEEVKKPEESQKESKTQESKQKDKE